MSASLPPNDSRPALVLGGGGPVGLSWMTGVAITLRELGIDLALAGRIVGTSAGAVVGAVLAGDGDLERIVNPPAGVAKPIQVDYAKFGEVMKILASQARGVPAIEALRQIGVYVTENPVVDQPDEHVTRIGNLIGSTEWPERELVITSVDVNTGELRAWTRDDQVSFHAAVASSTSVPGIFPPIPIDGGWYFDGGMRSPINADLAAGADLIVIIEPLAHMFPHTWRDAELGGAATISVIPDAEAIAAFGLDVFSPDSLIPAYEAGVRQAAEAAPRLKDVWPTR
ncbi:patatin-like phospholipase family protein [Nocardia sp. NPDC051030]|uniref:patatin-like phospholipase family protein n=1 Tax=Nocardia sp. NPDC051030 TaxID=3155162 RepID=UPI0034179425